MKLNLTLFYLALILMLFLGANILFALGYYNFWIGTVLSPALILFMMSFVFTIVIVKKFSASKSEVRLFIITICILLSRFVFTKEFAFTSFFPSIIFPSLFIMLVDNIKKDLNWKKILNWVDILFIIECVMAIVERVQEQCFFPDMPYTLSLNREGSTGFRSMALLGHPLSNSSMVSLIMIFYTIFKKNGRRKYLMLLIGVLALLCFNSRSSIVYYFLFFISYIVYTFYKEWKFTSIFTIVIISFLVFYVLSYTTQFGLGDRILETDWAEDSSINARSVLFDFISHLNLLDYLVGVNNNSVEILINKHLNDIAIIENCWLLFLLKYGFIALICGILAYIPVFRKVLSGLSKEQKVFIMIPWLLQISSSNSIATGGMSICSFFALILMFKYNYLYDS